MVCEPGRQVWSRAHPGCRAQETLVRRSLGEDLVRCTESQRDRFEKRCCASACCEPRGSSSCAWRCQYQSGRSNRTDLTPTSRARLMRPSIRRLQ